MKRLPKKRAQALVMVTLALFAMCGVLALAIDVGWSYYARKAARAAADTAALSAVRTAYASMTNLSAAPVCTAVCTPGMPCSYCSAPVTCASVPVTSNLKSGCDYAGQVGFTEGGAGGRQSVKLSSNITTPFVTATGNVAVRYWVTAEVSETIPQLFAMMLGYPTTTVRAKATAAIVAAQAPGSLILLNRPYDRTRMSLPGGGNQYGVNLYVQANDSCPPGVTGPCYALKTGGGIRMSSECGSGPLGTSNIHCSNGANTYFFSGENQGGGTVRSPETRIRGGGWYHLGGSAQWVQTPTNGHATGFGDPMEGKTQPPVPNAGMMTARPVANGDLNGNVAPCSGGVCPPGQYFAYEMVSSCKTCAPLPTATGKPIRVNGNVTFSDGGSFNSYVFYGGLRKAGGTSTVTFEPGVYVLAGVQPPANGAGEVFQSATNFSLTDLTGGGTQTDAGALFIATNGTYSGMLPQPTDAAWTRATGLASTLQFGTTTFQSGNNDTTITLHGLNPTHSQVINSGLQDWGSVLFWQDRNNATVNHLANGEVNTSCGSELQPCTNDLSATDFRSPELAIGASPRVKLVGTIYQPRGAWTAMVGGGAYSGPLRLVTGAIHVQAGSSVDLAVPQIPLTVLITSLIE